MQLESLPFSFHPDVLTILGEELVSDPIIALSELVKNSYDADAELVKIIFSEDPERSITISDDGHGMTQKDIARGWLVVGTPLKRDKTRSREKRRAFSGSMGMGRLVAFSLAELMEITTGTGDGYVRSFSMRLSDITRLKSLSEFEVTVTTEKRPDGLRGTVIALSELKDWWPDEKEIVRLRARLGALCGPEETQDFRVSLTIHNQTELLTPEQDLPEPPLRISARILRDGKAQVVVKANKRLYEGDRTIPRQGWKFTSEKEFGGLSGVGLKALWFPLGDRPAARYWKSTGTDIIKEAAGVRVYRDSVRVLPYGEPGNDWLELEKAYVTHGAKMRHPRPHSIVGWIFTSRLKNPDLKDTANREGLQDNMAVRELRTFGQWTFNRVSEVRRMLEPVVSRARAPRVEDVSAVTRSLRELRHLIPEEPEILEHFHFLERVTKAFHDQSEVTSLYRDRLTAGNLVYLVLHDVGASLKRTSPLLASASEADCIIDLHSKVFGILGDLIPRLGAGYDLLRGAGRAGAYRVSDVRVWETVDRLVKGVRLVEGSGANITALCGRITAKMREADLWSIVANLLLNAVTSSEFLHARERKFPPEREVVLEVHAGNSDLVIVCEDNGPGLPSRPEGWIWAPFNSTREGGGSGLGLYIVSDAVIWYAGTYEAHPAVKFPSGARFKIILPEVVTSAKR